MLVHESNKLSVKKVYRVKYAAERISTTIPVSHSIPEEAQIRPDLAPQIHTSFGLPGMSKEIKTFLDDARVQQDHFKNNGINIGIQYKSSVHLGKTALTSFKLLRSLQEIIGKAQKITCFKLFVQGWVYGFNKKLWTEAIDEQLLQLPEEKIYWYASDFDQVIQRIKKGVKIQMNKACNIPRDQILDMYTEKTYSNL